MFLLIQMELPIHAYFDVQPYISAVRADSKKNHSTHTSRLRKCLVHINQFSFLVPAF